MFIELGITYLLGIMIPGPSISLIIKNGILNSRKASFQSALGIVLGIAIQAGIVILCLDILEKYPEFFRILKISCSLYLISLGVKTIVSTNISEQITISNIGNKHNIFLESFIVEILNPFALTFFIGIMSLIIDPNLSWNILFLYWLEIVILGVTWFSIIAFLSSSQKISLYTRKCNKYLQTVAGLIFIFFGIKLLMH